MKIKCFWTTRRYDTRPLLAGSSSLSKVPHNAVVWLYSRSPGPPPPTTTTLFSHHLHRFKNMDPASTGPLLFFQICIAAGGGEEKVQSYPCWWSREEVVLAFQREYIRGPALCVEGGGGWCVGVGGWVGVACSHGWCLQKAGQAVALTLLQQAVHITSSDSQKVTGWLLRPQPPSTFIAVDVCFLFPNVFFFVCLFLSCFLKIFSIS